MSPVTSHFFSDGGSVEKKTFAAATLCTSSHDAAPPPPPRARGRFAPKSEGALFHFGAKKPLPALIRRMLVRAGRKNPLEARAGTPLFRTRRASIIEG
mmetsp:Transcript_26673/g.49844  ORF Transcript_26673/g.49844 Transcript_26673/m.49844 type:complete len:98 (+) Transcript_26673:1220-1513(+)